MYTIKTKDGDLIEMTDILNGKAEIRSRNYPEGIPGDFFVFCTANPPSADFLELRGNRPRAGLCLIGYKYDSQEKREIIYVGDEIIEVH